mgnify:CR=1 FL=1
MSPTENNNIRVVIIGPACCGKSTLAYHTVARANRVTIYDDPAPSTIDARGSWVYIAQNESDVPVDVMNAASEVLRHSRGYEFTNTDGVSTDRGIYNHIRIGPSSI